MLQRGPMLAAVARFALRVVQAETVDPDVHGIRDHLLLAELPSHRGRIGT